MNWNNPFHVTIERLGLLSILDEILHNYSVEKYNHKYYTVQNMFFYLSDRTSFQFNEP